MSKPMSKAQRAARRETAAPQARQAAGPDNPGVASVRCAMPIGDALADANTLRMFVIGQNVRGPVREQLGVALREGSRAVVEALHGDPLADISAEAAAHAAFRAVPGLRD